MVKDLDKPIFIFLLPLLLVKNDFGLPTLLQSLNCTDMMLGENKYCKKKKPFNDINSFALDTYIISITNSYRSSQDKSVTEPGRS